MHETPFIGGSGVSLFTTQGGLEERIGGIGINIYSVEYEGDLFGTIIHELYHFSDFLKEERSYYDEITVDIETIHYGYFLFKESIIDRETFINFYQKRINHINQECLMGGKSYDDFQNLKNKILENDPGIKEEFTGSLFPP